MCFSTGNRRPQIMHRFSVHKIVDYVEKVLPPAVYIQRDIFDCL